MAAELFNQFQTYWRAGSDARLNLECHAGKVWMTLQINLNCPPPPPPPPYRQQQRPRQSPSRLRRRARRAETRAAAKAAEREATADVAVQTKDDSDSPAASTLHHPVDVQQHHQVAGKATRHAEAAHALHVHDVICPDRVYDHLHAPAQTVQPRPSQDTLPQLDGHAEEQEAAVHHEDDDWINPHPITRLWFCRCCYYAHSFETEDDLRKHHDTLSIEYNECNICYPWHVWIVKTPTKPP